MEAIRHLRETVSIAYSAATAFCLTPKAASMMGAEREAASRRVAPSTYCL
ncbi:hypothetical protein NYD60_14485 [Burkholderia thailandensis]|nr:hypothetical protein [Burkholderia thailandensis]MBS2127639.1 hypothetical protein [Burkholderia thailandensis]MCS6501217.1 hypothetical protein [Burkholderia thailandensis]NBD02694.1 hypothetical protein [Burkholderia thailandensis]